MTDWKQLAAAHSIPAADADKIVPVLEALETSLNPLVESIPPGTDLWTGPEDAA
jgi:hypothetical protein